MCTAEKAWLRCRNGQTHSLKHTNVFFLSTSAGRKRNYWFEMQKEMVENAENIPNKFWKTIGRVGVRDNRKKEIPMEILNDDDEVIRDSNSVFDKWKTDFSK